MATKSTNANSKPRKGEHVDPEQKIETALDKTELFFQKYTKQLLTGLLVVVIVVGGYFAYEYLVKRPRAVKAAEMMFVARQRTIRPHSRATAAMQVFSTSFHSTAPPVRDVSRPTMPACAT